MDPKRYVREFDFRKQLDVRPEDLVLFLDDPTVEDVKAARDVPKTVAVITEDSAHAKAVSDRFCQTKWASYISVWLFLNLAEQGKTLEDAKQAILENRRVFWAAKTLMGGHVNICKDLGVLKP